MKSAPLLCLFLLLSWSPTAPAADKPAAGPVYAVAEYDPKRDPAKDLKAAVKLASVDGRRILLVVGGDWCGWCRQLSRVFATDREIAQVLAASYVIMKVNYSDENGNLFFLQDYPDIDEFPHFYVLDSNGKLLHSQANRAFEKLGGYRNKSMLEFFRRWAPKPAGQSR
jgi:thioredoxin-related protein